MNISNEYESEEGASGEMPDHREGEDEYNQIWSIVNTITAYMDYLISIFKILVFIFFVYNFAKKSKTVCSLYFYLLIFGFFIDLLRVIPNFLVNVSYNLFPIPVDFTRYTFLWWIELYRSVTIWYKTEFMCLWTLILCFNRLTAIVFWKNHKRLWAKFCPLIVAGMLVYPLILGYNHLIYFKCFHFLEYTYGIDFSKECDEMQDFAYYDIISKIAGQIIAVACFIVSLLVIYFYRVQVKSKSQGDPKNNKTEQKLFLQAIISSLSYSLMCLFAFLAPIFKSYSLWWIIFALLYNIFVYLYPISPYILIFVVSKPLRDQLLSFYGFNFLKEKLTGKQSGKSKTRAITIQSSTKTVK